MVSRSLFVAALLFLSISGLFADIQLTERAMSVKPGVYKHYKGECYRVLTVAVHSESLQEVVVYQAMYGKQITWVRPLAMFLEKVIVDGKEKPRFAYIDQ
jgi:cyclomaltodextrinase / maltogenic alpha-amylase / neopullulanase